MQREIKFRGKKVYSSKRVDSEEWIDGYYCFNGWAKQKHLIIPDYAIVLYGIEVIPETIGQFTSIYDKNDKKIYEGDIIKTEKSIGIIIFESAEFKIKWIRNPEFYNDILKIHADHLEIIGNIYDNPELMEVKNENI